MRLVNLTPHEVSFCDPAGNPVGQNLAPCAEPARRTIEREDAGEVEHGGVRLPMWRERLGEVTHLPAPEPGVLYVVSRVVADGAAGRSDLVVPSGLVRDERGGVLGCTSLTVVSGDDGA